jgi:hypothetical protein
MIDEVACYEESNLGQLLCDNNTGSVRKLTKFLIDDRYKWGRNRGKFYEPKSK